MGGEQVVFGILALVFLPRIVEATFSFLPSSDPLVMLVILFLVLAGAQQLGFATMGNQSSTDDDDMTARERQARRREAAAGRGPQEESSSKEACMGELLKDAERALQQNNWSRVKELARRIADSDPESARAWELLATAQKWDGDREGAAATVKKAREMYEVDSEGLAALARELESSQPSSAMVEEIEQKANDFFDKRQYDLAAECYRKALEAVGEAPEPADQKDLRLRLLRRQADCAQQLQDWGECRRAATELLEADPLDKQALLQRAVANEALEKFKAALEDARKLLGLDPKHAVANRLVHNCQQALRD